MVGSPDGVVEAVVVVEGALDVEGGSVEVDRLVGVDVVAAAEDEVDASVATPGGEQAKMKSRPTTLSRIGDLLRNVLETITYSPSDSIAPSAGGSRVPTGVSTAHEYPASAK